MDKKTITRDNFEHGGNMNPVIFSQWRSTVDSLAKARLKYVAVLLCFAVLGFLFAYFMKGTQGDLLGVVTFIIGIVFAGMTTSAFQLSADEKLLRKKLKITSADISAASKKSN